MRSAVNIQGLPQAIVPDNRHVIGVANSIGSNIRQGMDRRKEESNKERAAAIAKELVSGGVGEGLPQAIRPQLDPQAELQSQAVEIQRQKQVQQAEVQAEQAQKALTQRSNMQSMLNDPATKASLIELQSLDPQMARTVFTMLASADEQERLQVAQEAQRANDMFQNAAYFLQQDMAKGGKGDQFKSFVADAIRQEHARGADTSRLQELYRANPDEAIGLIQRNLALSGTVLKMPEVKRMTEKEAADVAIDQAELALKQKEFERKVDQDRRNYESNGSRTISSPSPKDFTIESLAKYEQTGNVADLVRYRSGNERRAQETITRGLDAARGLPVIKRGLELAKEIKTGGMSAGLLRAKQMFGVEGADEAELSSNLGKAVLSQLKDTFGSQFTEKEGERLERIEAGFGKSQEGNIRLLNQLLKMSELKVNQAIKRAESANDFDTVEEIQNYMNFDLNGEDFKQESKSLNITVDY